MEFDKDFLQVAKKESRILSINVWFLKLITSNFILNIKMAVVIFGSFWTSVSGLKLETKPWLRRYGRFYGKFLGNLLYEVWYWDCYWQVCHIRSMSPNFNNLSIFSNFLPEYFILWLPTRIQPLVHDQINIRIISIISRCLSISEVCDSELLSSVRYWYMLRNVTG